MIEQLNYELLEACKKFLGYSPYDSDSNICRGDGFYLNSLYNKYGAAAVAEMLKYCRNQARR